jgi:hypothetical protein
MKLLLLYELGFLDGNQETESKQASTEERKVKDK